MKKRLNLEGDVQSFNQLQTTLVASEDRKRGDCLNRHDSSGHANGCDTIWERHEDGSTGRE